MRSLELFTGTGGLALGLSLSGFEHVKFVENNKHACNSLRENFSDDLVFEGDIRDFSLQSLENISIVAGGPPCQPFSLGGKHRANEDNRDMFPLAINAIASLKPKAFIFENVKGLLRKSFSEYLDYIILRLSFPELIKQDGQDWHSHLKQLRSICNPHSHGLHYAVSYKLLNAANYGVPQTRERVFIVGIRSDLDVQWSFPKQTHSKKQLLCEQKNSGSYWARHKIKPDQAFLRTIRSTSNEQIPLFSNSLMPWLTVRDALSHLPDPSSKHNILDHIYKSGAKSYPGHTGSFIDLPAKTLKAGVHGVPGGENMIRFNNNKVRYFTTHEAKLIQTFPSNFIITGAWTETMRQIGNAVPVQLAEIIGIKLARTLLDANTIKSVCRQGHGVKNNLIAV